MNRVFKKFEASPLLARVVPFAVFVGLTFLQGRFGASSMFWIYALKTAIGAWFVWMIRPLIPEMKWKLSWIGVATGICIFVVWVGIDPWYPKIGAGIGDEVWNPHRHFSSTVAWSFIVVRIAGSTFVVPPLEEVFFRSFLYRYIANPDFQSVALGQFRWTPFLVTSAAFALEHSQWLAGLLCGFAYQGLVCRTGRIGDAITAHAVTNFLLGLWVVWRDAWSFW